MSEVPTRLMRETLRGRTTTSPSPECLDAETVAAWADEALNPQERAAAEAHAADCARCQALVAALAKTNPPIPARSWWRMPALGWLVPLTAAAAALVVWVNVSSRTRSVPIDRVAPVRTEAVASAAVPSPSDARRERKPDARPVDRLAAAKVSPGVSASSAVRPERAAAARRDAEQGAARDSIVPAPTPANAFSDSVPSATAAAASATAPAAPRGAAAEPPPPGRPAARSAAPATVALRATAQPAQPAPPAAAERATARMLLDVRQPPPVIVSTNPNNRWRIVAGGGVQHSTDGGSTWQAESTGVTATLTAGASPSPTICWLVGPGGIVLLSIDGRSWQRVAFPEVTDLASVRASDDKSAMVTTTDGRAFSTTDGGRTWVR